MKSSTAKSQANRKNALKSTGPKSKAGKRAVALNGVTHGLRSLRPVIPWLETEEDWERHRERVLADLSPAGTVETALAERVALGFWRLARCAEGETRVLESIRKKRRRNALGEALVAEGKKLVGQSAEEAFSILLAERDRHEAIAALWRSLQAKTNRRAPDVTHVNFLIDSVCPAKEWAKLEDDFNKAFVWPPSRQSEVREMLDWILERRFDAAKEAFEVFAAGASARAEDSSERIARIEAAVERATDLGLVEAEAMEKLLRNETTIHRALQKDLHELQRLQAQRQGQPVAAPLALDITTDS